MSRLIRLARKHRADLLAASSLLPLTLLFYWRIALSGQILASYDLLTYFYPYRDYALSTLSQGQLPLWNPYLFMGAPFLANIQTAVLYPLNWLGMALSAPQGVSLSILIHVFLAGAFMYAFGRLSVGLGWQGAWLGAVAFMFGGLVSQQVGHINQLNALAWLPLLLLLFDLGFRRRRLLPVILGGLVLTLQLLAGHPQQTYLSLWGVGFLALFEVFWQASHLEAGSWLRRSGRWLLALLREGAWAALVLGGMILLGLGLAGVQLLPTLELSSLSYRSGGLGYREAVSFSLPPWELYRALLPAFGDYPFGEYVAHVGTISLGLALFALFARPRHRFVGFGTAVVAVSLFLALGGYNPLYKAILGWVPGLDLFRVPARWLLLYTLAVSVMAGIGLDFMAAMAAEASSRPHLLTLRLLLSMGGSMAALALAAYLLGPLVTLPQAEVLWAWGALGGLVFLLGLSSPFWAPNRWVASLVAAIALGELFFAGLGLDYNRTVPPQAYTLVQPTLAQLLVAENPGRILSIASSEYDPGDRAEVGLALEGWLSAESEEEFISATKYIEIMAPNLPLTWHLDTVDGYDGGLLPLRRYVQFKELLLESSRDDTTYPFQGRQAADAVLRFQLSSFPDATLLGSLNVEYLIADKRGDVWVDHVYYDLAAPVAVSPGQPLLLSRLPRFAATALGLVAHLDEAGTLPPGTAVAHILIEGGGGEKVEQVLRAGRDVAEGRRRSKDGLTDQERPRVALNWANGDGASYLAMVSFGRPLYPRQIFIRYLLPSGRLHLQGASLIDERSHRWGGAPTSQALTVDERLELVNSGDVKLYRNREVLPRAFLVHRSLVAADPASALLTLGGDLRHQVLLEEVPSPVSGSHSASLLSEEDARVVSYEPERVVVSARLSQPGYLVLTDAYYPGWRVWVDGKETEILAADVLFRAVPLGPGEHRVEFRYQPDSLRQGMILSGLSLAVTLALLLGRGWRSGWLRRQAE